MKTFLSIIIPTYNCEKYIDDCLESCVNQGLLLNEYEIVCVDDCSKDDTYNKVKKFTEKHSNSICVTNYTNRGVSYSRNVGLNLAKGEYCIFLDGDDFLSENSLGKAKIIIENNKFDILGLKQLVFRETGDKRDKNIKKSFKNNIDDNIYLTNKIIKKSMIGTIRFKENITYGEDELFLFELKQKSFKPRLKKIDEIVYYYRIHNDSAMSLNSEEKRLKRIDSLIYAADYLINRYQPYNVDTLDFINDRIENAYNDIAALSLNSKLKKIKMLKEYKMYKIDLGNNNYKSFKCFYFKYLIIKLLNTTKTVFKLFSLYRD